MNPLFPKHFRSRKLNSFDEIYNTHYTDTFYSSSRPHAEFLATKDTNMYKPNIK